MKYRKAKIIKCCDPTFWYADKIGDTILVKNVSWPSAYVEHKSGSSVLESDLEYIAQRKTCTEIRRNK